MQARIKIALTLFILALFGALFALMWGYYPTLNPSRSATPKFVQDGQTASIFQPKSSDTPLLSYNAQPTYGPLTEPEVVRAPDEPIPAQVVIQFSSGTTQEERAAYIESVGGTVVENIEELDTVVVNVPKEVAAQPLPESSTVEQSEPDYFVIALDEVAPPNDPRFSEQWALTAIGAPYAWAQMGPDSAVVTIAVIDSGICANHPDLAGRIVAGWDFLENDATPQDDFGHGCSVAGVIAANMNNGIGIAGVAPNARIMPLRVLNASGVGSYSDVAAAIVYAVDHGAQVINLSLGGPNPSTTLQDAVDYATAHDVIVVAAAGNNGTQGALYPAAIPDVIAVGSIDPDLGHSSFSNYGSQIDIWAPGRDILTTKRDGGYGLVSGTSFAAPYVAGAEAVERALETSLSFSNSFLSFGEATSSTATSTLEATATLEPSPAFTSSPTIMLATLPENQVSYSDPDFGWSVQYPSTWQAKVDFENQGMSAEVIVKRVLFTTSSGELITVDVWDNKDQLALISWFNKNHASFLSSKASISRASEANGIVSGADAVLATDPDIEDGNVARKVAIFANSSLVYRVEYIATKGAIDESGFQKFLANFFLQDQSSHTTNLEALPYFPESIFPTGDPSCAGYSDSGNPYLCGPNNGNCTWWGHYKRPDIGTVSWGNARSWFGRAAQEGFVTGQTARAGALAVWGPGSPSDAWPEEGHVAYLESVNSDGVTFTMSEMDYYSGGPFTKTVKTNYRPDFYGFVYRRPGEIGGRVLNSAGQTVAGATVSIASGSVGNVTTNSSGVYIFHNVPGGSSVITATHSQFGNGSVNVNVLSSASVQAGDIRLYPICVQDVEGADCGGGGGLNPPGVQSPSEGQTFNSRSVHFTWQNPNSTNQDGYTFRITAYSNPDTQPWIFDQGLGNEYTSFDFTLPSEGRFYWHMRTWNTSHQASSWVTRSFVVSSPTGGGGGSGTNSWTAKYYDTVDRWWDNNNSGNYRCSETINNQFLDVNYGQGSRCGMDPETWIGEYTATINFSGANYAFFVRHDDGLKMWINGQSVADFGGSGDNWICPPRYLSGSTQLKVMLREDGGDAKVFVSWTTDTNVCTPPQSDLTPYTPSGASAPVVASLNAGNQSQDTLIAGRVAYFDWIFKNVGGGDAGPHHVKLWIDGQQLIDYPFNSLGAGNQGGMNDWQITWSRTGCFTVTMTVDSESQVNESNEGNNSWSGQMCWNPPPQPDLVPFARLGGTNPIEVSRSANSPFTETLISGQTAYYYWGYKNVGQMDAGAHNVQVYIDNYLFINYPFSGLGANSPGGFDNWSDSYYVSPGPHQVKIIVDPYNQVAESNESNNVWEGTVVWRAATVQITDIFTTDENGTASGLEVSSTPAVETRAEAYQSDFNIGDPIRLFLEISSDFPAGQSITADWEVTNPAGRIVPDLSWSEQLTTDGGGWWWYISRSISDNLIRGEYTFTGRVTFNGITTVKSTTFNVDGPPSIEAFNTFTTDGNGLNAASLERGPRLLTDDTSAEAISTDFTAGDPIQLYLHIFNDVADGELATYDWTVIDPQGRQVDELSWTGELESPAGWTLWLLPVTIPSRAVTGDYTFVGSITYGDRTTSSESTFHVTGTVTAPSNDNFGSSTLIGSVPSTKTQDTWTATRVGTDPSPSCGIGQNSNSVWYSYRPSVNGVLHADTFDSNFDTVVAIWTGSINNLTERGCNDDSFGEFQSWLEVPVAAGTTYYIEVMDWNSPGGGNLNLNVDFARYASNDDFNYPQTWSSLPFSGSSDIRAATQSTDDPALTACNRVPGQASVWYRYVPTMTGDLTLDTNGSNFDTMLAVWTGTQGNLVPIGCNDDIGDVGGEWDTDSLLTVAVQAGTTYYIEVSEFDGMIDFEGASVEELQRKPDQADQSADAGNLQNKKTEIDKTRSLDLSGTSEADAGAQFYGGTLHMHAQFEPYKAALANPAPGSTLDSPTINFQWNHVGAQEYWVYVGTSAGGHTLFDSGSLGTGTSVIVNNLPTNGTVIYVRLYTRQGSTWLFNDYTFNTPSFTSTPTPTQTPSSTPSNTPTPTNTSTPSNTPTPLVKSVMSSPAPGSTFNGATVNFEWTNVGAQEYWLDVGTAPGRTNIYSQTTGVNISRTMSGLPVNGSTIYVRLWTRYGSTWLFNDYTYTAAIPTSTSTPTPTNTAGPTATRTSTSTPSNTPLPPAKSVMSSPAPGSTLGGASVTFQWTNVSAQAYWLEIGTTAGGTNLLSQNQGTNTSKVVNGLPVNGSMIYVRLWTQQSGVWFYNDYTYMAAMPTSTATATTGFGFNSQFNGSSAGWGTHWGSWFVQSSQWYTTMGVTNQWVSASYSTTYSNLDYQARFWRDGCSYCANSLLIRGIPDPLDSDEKDWHSSYAFQYSIAGEFSVWKNDGSGWSALQNWTVASAVKQGGAWNELHVIANGTNLSFSINSTLVWTGTDTALSSGKVGVEMYSDGTSGDQLWIDWAMLSQPLGASSAGTVSGEQQALNDTSNANNSRGGNRSMSGSIPTTQAPIIIPSADMASTPLATATFTATFTLTTTASAEPQFTQSPSLTPSVTSTPTPTPTPTPSVDPWTPTPVPD